jgi:hypothetical protein
VARDPSDPVDENDIARVEALARVRYLLLDLGCTDEEIDRAVEDDVIDLLVVDRMLVPSDHRLTQAEVAERTDIPVDVAKRFWRALGFLDVDDAEAAFTDLDIEAIRIFQSMVAMGLVDLDSAVQMARVIGSSMARIAEAETAPGTTPIRATASSTPTGSPSRPVPRFRVWPTSSSTCGGVTSRPPPTGPCCTGCAVPMRGSDRSWLSASPTWWGSPC